VARRLPGYGAAQKEHKPWPRIASYSCTTFDAEYLKLFQEVIMGKYLIAWLLGVPATVLLIVYLL
jgi:hypothetical protein